MMNNVLDELIEIKKDRLKETLNWFPFPIIISFIFVSIFSSYLFLTMNPRLGSRVNTIRYYSTKKETPVNWVGLYANKKNMVIVTSDRRKFEIKRDDYHLKGLEVFIKHLKNMQNKHFLAFGRNLDDINKRSRFSISIDRDLKFKEIRPLIYALAEANISNYEIETQLIK